MLGRALVVIAALVGAILIAVFGLKFAGVVGKPAPAQTATSSSTTATTPVAAPWDGSATRVYDADYILSGHQMELVQAEYRGLNYPSSSLTITYSARSAGAIAPRWLTRVRFTMTSPAGGLWLPAIRTFVINGTATVRLSFPSLPTLQIAADRLTLQVKGQGTDYGLGLKPPPPPPGHAFAESPQPKPVVPVKPKPAKKSHRRHHRARRK